MSVDIVENYDAWIKTFRENWLKKVQETGEVDWDIYNRPNNKIQPTGKGIDLRRARMVLISTAGGYLKDSQEPFEADDVYGDYTVRCFPVDTPFEQIAYAHNHYDHTAINADPQVLLPLLHLRDMVNERVIGKLAPDVINFMGYQPDCSRVVDEMIPDIVAICKEMDVEAALLVPS